MPGSPRSSARFRLVEAEPTKSAAARVLVVIGTGFVLAGIIFAVAIIGNFESSVEGAIDGAVDATDDDTGFVALFALLGSSMGLLAAVVFVGGGAIVIGSLFLITALFVKARAK